METDKIYMASFDDLVDVIEYYESGLQVWAKDDKIFNIICSPEEDD
ncbi:hypothetical protein GCM10009122_42330 [Fulvivirga kasyanovii]